MKRKGRYQFKSHRDMQYHYSHKMREKMLQVRDPRENRSVVIVRGPYQGMTALCGKVRGNTAMVQFDNMNMPGYQPWIEVKRRDMHMRHRPMKRDWF